jgi:hypothetical protein
MNQEQQSKIQSLKGQLARLRTGEPTCKPFVKIEHAFVLFDEIWIVHLSYDEPNRFIVSHYSTGLRACSVAYLTAGQAHRGVLSILKSMGKRHTKELIRNALATLGKLNP